MSDDTRTAIAKRVRLGLACVLMLASATLAACAGGSPASGGLHAPHDETPCQSPIHDCSLYQ